MKDELLEAVETIRKLAENLAEMEENSRRLKSIKLHSLLNQVEEIIEEQLL